MAMRQLMRQLWTGIAAATVAGLLSAVITRLLMRAVTHLLNGIPQFSLGGSAFIALQDRADPSSRAMARSGRCLELASLEWVDWYNNQRLFEAIRDIPPVEAEATTTAQPNHLETCRWQNQPPLDPGFLCVCQAADCAVVESGVAGSGSDLSEELVVGVEPAALDVRAAPDCPPGSVADVHSSRIICRQTWSASRRLRQRIASLWVFPAAILVP
jgi:hypothetical protein